MGTSSVMAFIVVVGILAACALWGGGIKAFLDIPTFVLILGGALATTAISFSPSDIGSAVRAVWKKGNDQSEQIYDRAILIFGAMRKRAIAFGIIGFFIGCVTLLTRLDDPAAIGPPVAVALLSVLYGVCIAELVFAPLMAVAKKKMI